MNKISLGIIYMVFSTSLPESKTSESSVPILGKSAILSQRLVAMLWWNQMLVYESKRK